MDYFTALTAFIEAAEGNNFSRAAERLGIKASTVSRYVKELEQDLGIALFNRSTRTLNQHPRGVLKLNLPPAFARHHILPALNDFLARYPQISVELVLDNNKVNLIHAGVDLAIRIGELADSTLKARKLSDGHYRLVVSPAFGTQHPPPSTPTDLAGVPAVLGTATGGDISFVSAGRAFPLLHDGVIRINDLDAQLIAVRQGLGFGLLPDWLVARSIEAGELAVWLPEWHIQGVERAFAVWFVYPPKRIVSSKVRCFIDFIVERLGETPDWK